MSAASVKSGPPKSAQSTKGVKSTTNSAKSHTSQTRKTEQTVEGDQDLQAGGSAGGPAEGEGDILLAPEDSEVLCVPVAEQLREEPEEEEEDEEQAN